MSTSSKPKFGFNVSDIQPGPVPARDIDKVAERLGFQSREAAPVRRRRRQGSEEPTDQINLRAEIIDINRFVEWCERERLSYREGFSRLVKLIDKA